VKRWRRPFALAVLPLALTACGGGSHSADRSASTTTRPTSNTSLSSITPILPTTVGTATCAATDLEAAVNTGAGAGGFTSGVVTLTNHSVNACSSEGFPGVELLGANGGVITNAARGCVYLQGCSTSLTNVILEPDASAYFVFVWRDNPPEPSETTCPESVTALVTPPNAFDHLTLPLHIAPCGLPPVFGVGTVQAGTGVSTTVDIFNPWTPVGTLEPGYTALGHLYGGSCLVGSKPWSSLADPSNEYAWRCDTDRGIYDPCFAPRGKTDVSELACVITPYLRLGVYLLELSKPLAQSSTGFTPRGVWPLILILSNGDQCSVIQGTASPPFYYGCNHGSASEPATAREPWTVSYLPNGANARLTVAVNTAWE
jgi:hypothetical protein